MSVTREEVYKAVDSERDYQDAQRGNAARHEGYKAGENHPAEFILYMEKCLADAREAVYKGSTGANDCLQFVRKVTALGVACMEQHGAPQRA
jgi:hypothetical protein